MRRVVVERGLSGSGKLAGEQRKRNGTRRRWRGAAISRESPQKPGRKPYKGGKRKKVKSIRRREGG